MLSVLGPRRASEGSSIARMRCKRVEKFVDGGIAQFGIGGVRHFAGGSQRIAEYAFGAEGEAGFRWARR